MSTRHPVRLLFSLLLTCMLFTALACNDTSTLDYTDGDSPDGDNPDGDAPDGDDPDGDNPDGDVPDGDNPDGDAPDGDAPSSYELPAQWLGAAIDWRDCDLYEGTTPSSQVAAECADLDMPLNWDDPDGQTLSVRIKRVTHAEGATRQVWVLHGGPGGPGTTGLAFMADYLTSIDPKTDVYLLDHRGTGFSTRINCPEGESDSSPGGFSMLNAEWPSCLDYLTDEWEYSLDYFNVTQASIDVAYLVELTKRADQDSFVYGVSYGAYWGHRYGQLFPAQARGIILDSIPPAVPTYLDRYDLYANENILKLFAMCADDELCRSKLGDDPAARAAEILQDFKDGHCSELVDTYGIDMSLFMPLLFQLGRDVNSRILVPAIYYRLDRCDEEDVKAIYNAALTAFGAAGGSVSLSAPGLASFADRQYGVALGNHIIISELLSDEPMSVSELEEAYDDVLVNAFLGTRMMSLADSWPVYEWDGFVRQWADKSVPFLMLQSDFDLQSPIEVAVSAKEHLNGERQYFVEIPMSNHGVVTQSPVRTAGKPDCGAQIMLAYMDNPDVQPDMGCLADLRPVDFNGEPAYTRYYFGQPDAWENPDLSVGCGMPDDFMDFDVDKHLGFMVNLPIADWQPGLGLVEVQIGDISYDVSSYAVAVSRRPTRSGGEVIVITGYGDLKQVSSVEISMNYTETSISLTSLGALKGEGEYRMDYRNSPAGANFFTYMAQVNDKTIDQTRYVKICPKGVLSSDGDTPSLYVCHDGNNDFSKGETFNAAGNIPLTDDPDEIAGIFANDEACFCYVDGGDTFSCDEWETAGQQGAVHVKSGRLPLVLRNFSLPPLPRYLPENTPIWRRSMP